MQKTSFFGRHSWPGFFSRTWKLFLFGVVGALLFTSSCSTSTLPISTKPRLLLTPFRGKSFGTSFQVPVLVAAEVTGKFTGKLCLLMQIDYTSTDKMRLQPNQGSFLSSTDPDVSEAVYKKYEACDKAKKPCLIAVLDSKKREFVGQVELLTPQAGGLVVGGLFKGDCNDDNTFEATNIIAREALAIGAEFRFNSENAKEGSTTADGGTDGGTEVTPETNSSDSGE